MKRSQDSIKMVIDQAYYINKIMHKRGHCICSTITEQQDYNLLETYWIIS